MNSGNIYISGTSGAGKTTLSEIMIKVLPDYTLVNGLSQRLTTSGMGADRQFELMRGFALNAVGTEKSIYDRSIFDFIVLSEALEVEFEVEDYITGEGYVVLVPTPPKSWFDANFEDIFVGFRGETFKSICMKKYGEFTPVCLYALFTQLDTRIRDLVEDTPSYTLITMDPPINYYDYQLEITATLLAQIKLDSETSK